MEAVRNLILASVVLIVLLFVYVMVHAMYAAQNTTGWDTFAITFFGSTGLMLLLMVGVIAILILVVKMISERMTGL